MSESLGLTSHKSNCNCTGCGMLRAGVCINCAEKIAALIVRPRRNRRRAVLGYLPRGDRAVLLHAARALARAASAVAVGATVAAAMPPRCHWRRHWRDALALRAIRTTVEARAALCGLFYSFPDASRQ